MRYFEKCVTSGSCLHLTVQKSRLWSYQKVIRLSSLIQSKLLEIIVDYIRGEQLQKTNFTFSDAIAVIRCEIFLSHSPPDRECDKNQSRLFKRLLYALCFPS